MIGKENLSNSHNLKLCKFYAIMYCSKYIFKHLVNNIYKEGVDYEDNKRFFKREISKNENIRKYQDFRENKNKRK